MCCVEQKAQVPLDDYEIEKVLSRLDAGKEGKISYQYEPLFTSWAGSIDNSARRFVEEWVGMKRGVAKLGRDFCAGGGTQSVQFYKIFQLNN